MSTKKKKKNPVGIRHTSFVASIYIFFSPTFFSPSSSLLRKEGWHGVPEFLAILKNEINLRPSLGVHSLISWGQERELMITVAAIANLTLAHAS